MSISFSSRVETSVNKKKGSLWVQHPSAEEKRVVMIGNGVPRNDFHIFPFRTQIRDPEKGKINRQSSSILLHWFIAVGSRLICTRRKDQQRGGRISFPSSNFSLFLFFYFFFRFSATAGKTNQNETQLL